MYERDIHSISIACTALFGRPANSQIDINELNRYIETSKTGLTNSFLRDSLLSKDETENKEDKVSFDELGNRIHNAMICKNDSTILDMMMQCLDKNNDGYIDIDDISDMCTQIGSRLTREELKEFLEKVSEDGEKIHRAELSSIFWF